MNQRNLLERELEEPYENDHRQSVESHYVAGFLNDLRDVYDCPPGHDQALARWAFGHPAVGGVIRKSYREKFRHPRLTREDLPAKVREPLENALIDYVRDVLPSFEGDAHRSQKHARLLGVKSYERLMIWTVQQDPSVYPQRRNQDWWFDFTTPPETTDLIDRLEFLRICHHTNLKVVRLPPFVPEPPFGRNIFHPLSVQTHLASLRERYLGKLLPRDEYEDEYPFETVRWTNHPKA